MRLPPHLSLRGGQQGARQGAEGDRKTCSFDQGRLGGPWSMVALLMHRVRVVAARAANIRLLSCPERNLELASGMDCTVERGEKREKKR